MSHITTIKLSGLTCSACQKITQKLISKIDGVHDVQVDLQTGDTTITADRVISTNEIDQVLEGTHYHISK